jgi:hypothetical protein
MHCTITILPYTPTTLAFNAVLETKAAAIPASANTIEAHAAAIVANAKALEANAAAIPASANTI